MVDLEALRCIDLIDLGQLGATDRYVDLALLIGSARESRLDYGGAQAAYNCFSTY
jgi:aminoglycoside phosphotransferase